MRAHHRGTQGWTSKGLVELWVGGLGIVIELLKGGKEH